MVLEKEKFVVLEGVLYFVRKDRIRLVVPEVLERSSLTVVPTCCLW